MADREMQLESLAPCHSSHVTKYETYLDEVFLDNKDNKYKNIAITGPFGSGKSSILQTYLERKGLKHVSISLSCFENKMDENQKPNGGQGELKNCYDCTGHNRNAGKGPLKM